MNEIIDKNSALSLIENKGFYGVVATPDGQRFRFKLSEVIEKLSSEDFERIRDYAMASYEDGKELYEKTLAENTEPEENAEPGEYDEYFDKSRNDFLNSYENSHKSGQSRAKFYLCYEICRKALEEIELKIYSEESKEEWQEAGCSIKFTKEEEKRRSEQTLKAVESKAYWKGYDTRRAEERKEKQEDKSHNRKNLLRFWFDK